MYIIPLKRIKKKRTKVLKSIKKDPAASYLRRGKPNYCRRESA